MRLRFVLFPVAAASCASIYLLWAYFKKKRSVPDFYETKKLLNEYLLFHYGSKAELIPWDVGPVEALEFPRRCADLCAKHFNRSAGAPDSAFDVGCGVGGATFELTRHFQSVLGIDFSQAFIEACLVLKKAGRMDYEVFREGDVYLPTTAVVSSNANRKKASFEWGDACSLRRNIGSYGCVLAANLICRLPDPVKFLDMLPQLVAQGGILVVTSPYSQMELFTPKAKWLGGFTLESGEVQLAAEGLMTHLLPNFDLIESVNMPFLIKQSARKYEYVVSHATVWRRK